VPHEPGAPIGELQILPVGQERLHLQVHSLREQPPGAGAQHIRQGVVDVIGLTKADDVGNLSSIGVSLSLRGSGRLDTRLDTPPSIRRRHPVSCIARLRHRPGSPRARMAEDDDGSGRVRPHLPASRPSHA